MKTVGLNAARRRLQQLSKRSIALTQYVDASHLGGLALTEAGVATATTGSGRAGDTEAGRIPGDRSGEGSEVGSVSGDEICNPLSLDTRRPSW
eukprot:scaffold3086_cov393-Prasinococcus_capsulatus_cf.AAC.2